VTWSELSEWWSAEIVDDPAYEEVITPLLIDILRPQSGLVYLDLGCGEGRVMRAVAGAGGSIHGVDINIELLLRAASSGPVVAGELPDLSFLRDDSYHGAYCVLVLEHIEDHVRLLEESARVVRPGGVLALVMNHPMWTAPGSTPITDFDGETLWRPGDYFSGGATLEPAGSDHIVFHHRSTAELTSAAAGAGWSLERMIEAPHHDLTDQRGIPRLMACRWRLLP
jgi:SAM-dependent methyltransferase